MLYNLHTHSFYCGHGEGRIGEYVSYAQEKGYSILGFTEHCPFPDNLFRKTRMDYSMMEAYEEDVRSSDSDKMKVLLGYEADYFPSRMDYYQSVRERVDYLISGTHFVEKKDGHRISLFYPGVEKEDLAGYLRTVVGAMESGLFAFIAHPDVFLSCYPFDDTARGISRDIIEAAKDIGIPLEINGNGMLKAPSDGCEGYPSRSFWEIASSVGGVRTVLSTDAHKVENIDRTYPMISEFASHYGIEVVEPEWNGSELEWRRR